MKYEEELKDAETAFNEKLASDKEKEADDAEEKEPQTFNLEEFKEEFDKNNAEVPQVE